MTHRVFGEDAPLALPVALTSGAFATALGVALLVARPAASAARDADEPATPAPVPAPAPAPSVEWSPVTPPAGSLQVSAGPPAAAAAEQTAPRSCALPFEFGAGLATPSSAVAAEVRALAAFLREHPEATVVVDGHADSLGSEELNLRLSKRRADALAWVLESSGVARTRVTARGFGSFSPAEGTREDAASNRRAVVHVRGGCPSVLVPSTANVQKESTP
jgi:outer membrane protein OmpA-like peptidoglycan-associated protein